MIDKTMIINKIQFSDENDCTDGVLALAASTQVGIKVKYVCEDQ